MNNVLYNRLPYIWEKDGVEYILNTSFCVGVQLSLLFEDKELTGLERMYYMTQLLFGNKDGTIRNFPQNPNDFEECLYWFLSGWHHDNPSPQQEHNEKVMDYYVDQGRIYADFRQIYGINLNTEDMHWWEFQWMLWNMPDSQSSFLTAVKIRTQKPREGASAEEIKAIKNAKASYGLEREKIQEYTKEQEKAIDDYDRMMAEIRARKMAENEALIEFRKG